MLYHADVAEEAISQQGFLSRFPIQLWIAVFNHYQKHDTRRFRTNANFLYILADEGFPNLIRRWLKDNPQTDVFGEKERFRYPLFAAWANGNKSSVAALLGTVTTKHDGVDITDGLDHIKDLVGFVGRTPLSWACQEGRIGIAKLLLEKGANALEADGHGEIGYSRALMHGQEEILKLLGAYHGASSELDQNEILHVMKTFSETGSDRIIEYLIGHGADVNAEMFDASQSPIF